MKRAETLQVARQERPLQVLLHTAACPYVVQMRVGEKAHSLSAKTADGLSRLTVRKAQRGKSSDAGSSALVE